MEVDVVLLGLYGARLLHVLMGIVWLGIVYFYNFVSLPRLTRRLEATGDRTAVLDVTDRAIWASALGAALSLGTGVVMLYVHYLGSAEGALSNSLKTILTGSALGAAMTANVWLVLRPAQHDIMASWRAGTPVAQGAVARLRRAGRLNVVLSLPTLACMIGASRYPLDWPGLALLVAGTAALGAAAVVAAQRNAGS